jgi:hypothetical protein
MVNDDGAIKVIPLDTPAIKLYPIAILDMIVVMIFGDDTDRSDTSRNSN